MIEFWDTFLTWYDENFDCAKGGLFILLGMGVALVLGGTGLLKRNRRWYSIIVGMNYVYLPVVIIMSCSMFYAYRIIGDGFATALETNRNDIIVTSVEHTLALNKSLSFQHGDASRMLTLEEIKKEIIAGYESEYESDLSPDDDFGVLSNLVIPYQKAAGTSLAKAVIDNMAASLEGRTQMSAESWQRAWGVATVPVMKGDLGVKVLEKMTSKLMSILWPNLYKTAAWALVPSLLEILLYALYSRRRRLAVA